MLVFGLVIAVAFGLWNVVFRQGRTGYTLGKEAVGIRLVGDRVRTSRSGRR